VNQSPGWMRKFDREDFANEVFDIKNAKPYFSWD
jgi:hypothetical protein